MQHFAVNTELCVVEEMLSEDEDPRKLYELSVNKVNDWIVEPEVPIGSQSERVIRPADDSNDWEIKNTPKTVQNREMYPKSSFLTLQRNEVPKKEQARNKGNKNKLSQNVTRTLNPGTNTMTVSSLPQKSRGRRNQRSYVNITGELQYLR